MSKSEHIASGNPMNIWNKRGFAMHGFGKKLKYFFTRIKWSGQRITRGYCDYDVCEMYSYLQTLLPDMLQAVKETGMGSPRYSGAERTDENGIAGNDISHEEWNRILDRMIFLWRETDKDTCSKKNPYDEEHSKAMDEFSARFGWFGDKLQTEKESEADRELGVSGTMHFMYELPEYKEISDKFCEEEKRLEEYRRSCKDEAMDMLKLYFFDLWN